MHYFPKQMASVYHAEPNYAMSRIPMRIGRNGDQPQKNNYSGYTNYHDQKMKNHLSPLQKLQMEYQEKLQLEKEKKMTFLYEKWSQEALERVERHSGKRRPNQRQNMASNTSKGNYEQNRENSGGYTVSHQRRLAASAQQKMNHRRPQKLPPLNNTLKAKSFHTSENWNATTSQKPTNGHRLENVSENPYQNDFAAPQQEEEGHSSPPPNIQHLRLLRERRLKQKKLMKMEKQIQGRENPEDLSHKTRRKLTDFEKWQQQQDAGKMERLKNHYARQQGTVAVDQGFGGYTEDVVPPPVKNFDKKKHKASNKTFVASTIKTKRSSSPVIKPVRNGHAKKQETIRQGMENEKRIAELEREMKQKQLDLIRIHEREKRSRLDSLGNVTSASDNESDNELRFATSDTPILKPVKVPSKRTIPSHHSGFSGDDTESVSSDMGFQMKPVLVRRDGSRSSSRGTPQKDKTYLVRKPIARHNPRNKTFMSPNLRIREEEEAGHNNNNHHPPPVAKSPPHPAAYPLHNVQEDEENVILDVIPCGICGRKFTEDRLSKHMNICSKNQGKKRKAFDMTKARTQGTDAEKFVRRKAYARSATPPAKKVDWRRKHDEFINTIRNAKMVQQHVAKGGKITDLPPPPPSENPDYVKCQYCERRFNPTVAERHIPRCKDIKSRPKPPKRK